MYQYLSGRLAEKGPTAIVLEVGGVGYHLQVPLSTGQALPAIGETVRIFTHFVVREDAHLLYGFLTEDERSLFRMLISVSGIGPKIAMTLLSGIPMAELKQAIIDGALPILTSISGIGRKIAERIVVELREKLVIEERRVPSFVSGKAQERDSVVEDSVRALIELGYRRQTAREAVEKALKHPDLKKNSVTDLVRTSLKYV